jgi:hypothetical protein
LTRAAAALAGRTPAERFGEIVERRVVFSLSSRASRWGFAGEATLASNGVVENAVPRR